MVVKQKDLMAHWNVAYEYLKQQLSYIEKFHDSALNEEYYQAYRQLRNIINYSSFYINKEKKMRKIEEMLPVALSFKSQEYKDAKNEGNKELKSKLEQKSIDAMYEIMEEIMEIFGKLGAHVQVYYKSDSVSESARMC